MLIRQNSACFPKANRPRGAGARRQRNSRISTGQDCSQSQSSPCLPITRREFLKSAGKASARNGAMTRSLY
jgi:hypothetical protein